MGYFITLNPGTSSHYLLCPDLFYDNIWVYNSLQPGFCYQPGIETQGSFLVLKWLSMNKIEIEEIEIDLLLEAIYKRYGYDFRHYSRSSINRRIKHFLSISGLKSITAMTEKLLFDNSFFQSMVNNFSITVTEMFRDPKFYLTLREEVIPFLKTYPFIKIWHAGCATGEEAYSLAIVLHEENFLDRTRIIATDFNDLALEQAKSGVFPIHNLKIFADNYQNAGGKATLSDYYKPKYESIIINQNLKDKIYFANHNLLVDKILCEAN